MLRSFLIFSVVFTHSLMEDGGSPDPGGGVWGDKRLPPSPAAFTSVHTSEERIFETVINNRSKRRAIKRDVRACSPTDSSGDDFKIADDDLLITPVPSTASIPASAPSSSASLSMPLGQKSAISATSSGLPPGQKVLYTPVARQKYMTSDSGPFVVHVQKIEQSPTAGTTLHPVTFGRFLFGRAREFQGIVDGSIKNIGRNKISLAFHSANSANSFIESSSLTNNGYRAFVPTYNVTRLGLVRGIPIDMSPEDIIKEVRVPQNCGPIIKARRLNFKLVLDGVVTWKPSQTCVLTFDGQVFPSRVFLCYNSFQVERYTLPTIQCFQCCRYGHTKMQCRSKPACYKCSQAHSGDLCNVDADNIKCVWCRGKHFATNKACPEMARQMAIKAAMSQNSLSYAEASKLHSPSKLSFAEVVSSPTDITPSTLSSQLSGSYKNLNVESARVHYRGKSAKPVGTRVPTPVGYDHLAHSNIIRGDFSGSASNGCALNNPETSLDTPTVQSVIADLLRLLNLLSSLLNSSPHPSPSNAAFNLNSLISLLHNGSQPSSKD